MAPLEPPTLDLAPIAAGETLGPSDVGATRYDVRLLIDDGPAGHAPPPTTPDVAALAERAFVSGFGVAANTRMGGSSTLGGMDHATQSLLKYSQKHPEEGLFDVIGHGSPNCPETKNLPAA